MNKILLFFTQILYSHFTSLHFQKKTVQNVMKINI